MSGIKYLSGKIGFKWHVPLKSVMSLKKMRTFLSDLTDLSDLSGKPRAGLARVSPRLSGESGAVLATYVTYAT